MSAAGQTKLERLIGPASARMVWDVSVAGLALMKELIARHHIDCDWVDGYLLTAVKERHARELHAELEELRGKLAYPSVRYVPRDELRSLLATGRYIGALYDSNSGHLHPLNYNARVGGRRRTGGSAHFRGHAGRWVQAVGRRHDSAGRHPRNRLSSRSKPAVAKCALAN